MCLGRFIQQMGFIIFFITLLKKMCHHEKNILYFLFEGFRRKYKKDCENGKVYWNNATMANYYNYC